jgi:hypothetical protein
MIERASEDPDQALGLLLERERSPDDLVAAVAKGLENSERLSPDLVRRADAERPRLLARLIAHAPNLVARIVAFADKSEDDGHLEIAANSLEPLPPTARRRASRTLYGSMSVLRSERLLRSLVQDAQSGALGALLTSLRRSSAPHPQYVDQLLVQLAHRYPDEARGFIRAFGIHSNIEALIAGSLADTPEHLRAYLALVPAEDIRTKISMVNAFLDHADREQMESEPALTLFAQILPLHAEMGAERALAWLLEAVHSSELAGAIGPGAIVGIHDPGLRRSIIFIAFQGSIDLFLLGRMSFAEVQAWFGARQAIEPISGVPLRRALAPLERLTVRDDANRYWLLVMLFQEALMNESPRALSEYVRLVFGRTSSPMSQETASIWATILQRALSNGRRAGLDAAATSFDLACTRRFDPLGKVVMEAFPPVYAELPAKRKRSFSLFDLFGFFEDDFDSRKAARHSLVDIFLASHWSPPDLAFTALKSKFLQNVVDRLRHLGREDYLFRMIKELRAQQHLGMAEAVENLAKRT